MKLIWLMAVFASGVMGLTASAAAAPSQWDQPAAALAEQIAGILGPGQAHLTIRNLSTIPTDEIPAIRRLLEEDLKTRGVTTSEAETANVLRVTLSENVRELLWVAEIVEGNETRVAMVEVELGAAHLTQSGGGVSLRRQSLFVSRHQVLNVLLIADALVAVEPEEIVVYGNTTQGWQEQKRVRASQKRPIARDPRGMIVLTPLSDGFEVFLPGTGCNGSFRPALPAAEWTIRCHESDDPWPISWAPIWQKGASVQDDISFPPLRAFYNSSRNYFTGVTSPSLGTDSPPFYAAAWLSRPSNQVSLLMGGIDGKVQLVENGTLKPVSGTRDWGSDFAALKSGCGAGTQIIASGSGEAINDSLRAYELPAQEAIPASAPLAMEGTVTALWSAPDGKSVFAVVRKTAGPGSADSYEVDRVTSSCNE